MFCGNCGSKLEAGDGFCPNCGTKVEETKTEEVKEEKVEETKTEEVKVEAEVETKEEVKEETKTETVESVEVKEEKKDNVSNNIQPSNIPGGKEKIKKGASSSTVIIIVTIILILAAIGAALYFFVFKNKDSKQDVDVVTKALQNTVDVKNFSMSIKGDVKVTVDKQKIEGSASLDYDFDVKNKKAKMDIEVEYSGASISIPAYIDCSDDCYVYYKLPASLSKTTEWYKTKLDAYNLDEVVQKDTTIDDETLEKIKKVLEKQNSIKKVNSDISDAYKYEINIDKKLIVALAKEFGADTNEDDVNLKSSLKVELYVNKKDNTIRKIAFDMADFLSEMMGDKAEIDKLYLSIEYTNLNGDIDVEIPKEALNAKEQSNSNLIPGTTPTTPVTPVEPTTPVDPSGGNTTKTGDNVISDYDYTITFDIPEGFKASSVNSDYFKIFSTDDLYVTVSIDRVFEDKFEEIKDDFDYYNESSYYANAKLSDVKKLTYKGKEFEYMILTYEDSDDAEYKYYQAQVIYKLDDKYIYNVSYEKESEITEDDLKLFINIDVEK